jgi:flagellar hook-associated protein 1 FlgK
MTTLSAALNFALSCLSVASGQSAIASRNVSCAGDANYTRRSALVITLPGGGASLSATMRSMDRVLLDKSLAAGSAASGKTVILEALQAISSITGDPEDGSSVPALLGKLQEGLTGR